MLSVLILFTATTKNTINSSMFFIQSFYWKLHVQRLKSFRLNYSFWPNMDNMLDNFLNYLLRLDGSLVQPVLRDIYEFNSNDSIKCDVKNEIISKSILTHPTAECPFDSHVYWAHTPFTVTFSPTFRFLHGSRMKKKKWN